jgi:hypothetical protein
MVVLSEVLARGILLINWVLDEWTDLGTVTNTTESSCWTLYEISGNVNACGEEFLGNVVDLIEGLTALAPALLAGLFVKAA